MMWNVNCMQDCMDVQINEELLGYIYIYVYGFYLKMTR